MEQTSGIGFLCPRPALPVSALMKRAPSRHFIALAVVSTLLSLYAITIWGSSLSGSAFVKMVGSSEMDEIASMLARKCMSSVFQGGASNPTVSQLSQPNGTLALAQQQRAQRVMFLESQVGREVARIQAAPPEPMLQGMANRACAGKQFRKSQSNEDSIIYDLFFNGTYSKSFKPQTSGTFIEMGALDGVTFSNSYFFEHCLGWRGLLMEANPTNYEKVLRNRPSMNVVRLNMAACKEDGGVLEVSRTPGPTTGVLGFMPERLKLRWGHRHRSGLTWPIPCGPLSKYLVQAGLTRIDFFSLDVEGAEAFVLSTIDWRKIEVHVLMVELSEEDERDEALREQMRALGFSVYPANTVDRSDLFVNESYVSGV